MRFKTQDISKININTAVGVVGLNKEISELTVFEDQESTLSSE
jgi:hypothetical protein